MSTRRSALRLWLQALALPAAALATGAVEAGVKLFTPVSREEVVLQIDVRSEQRWATAIDSSDRASVLRAADRLQFQHRFDEAEALLTRWLRESPLDTDVLLQRAQLRIAQKNPRGALADCLRAAPRLDALAASACQAQAEGALGQVAGARRLVESALAHTHSTASVASWAQGIAAELAARDGATSVAEGWYRAALATDGSSHYPRVAYAQFLLDQKRPDDALQLLAAAPDTPSVMRLRRRALEFVP